MALDVYCRVPQRTLHRVLAPCRYLLLFLVAIAIFIFIVVFYVIVFKFHAVIIIIVVFLFIVIDCKLNKLVSDTICIVLLIMLSTTCLLDRSQYLHKDRISIKGSVGIGNARYDDIPPKATSIARDECLDALSCRTGDTKLAPDAFGWFLGVQTESHVEG